MTTGSADVPNAQGRCAQPPRFPPAVGVRRKAPRDVRVEPWIPNLRPPVRPSSASEIDAELMAWVRSAYDAAG